MNRSTRNFFCIIFFLLFVAGPLRSQYLPGRTYTNNYIAVNIFCVESSVNLHLATDLPGGATLINGTGIIPANSYFGIIKVTFTTPPYPGAFSYNIFDGINFLPYIEPIIVTDTPYYYNQEHDFILSYGGTTGTTKTVTVTNPAPYQIECSDFTESVNYKISVYPPNDFIQISDTLFTLGPGESKQYTISVSPNGPRGAHTYWIETLRNGGNPILTNESKYDKVSVYYRDSIIMGDVRQPLLCPGATFTIPFTTIGRYNPGNRFILQLSDANGSFQSPVNIGSVDATESDSIIATIPPNTPTADYGYDLRIISTNTPDTSDKYTTPSHFITIKDHYEGSSFPYSEDGLQLCKDEVARFTAFHDDIVSPVYQWRVNGVNTGTNSPEFETSALKNGDIVTVKVTGGCPSNFIAYPVQVQVDTLVIPGITIEAETGDTICINETHSFFTAHIMHGGADRQIQWYRNGVAVGDGTEHYETNDIEDGDEVYAKLTSSLPCAEPGTVISNSITIIKKTSVETQVHIDVLPGDTVCAGTGVMFRAFFNNEYEPAFQWYKNGLPVGSGDDNYIDYGIQPGDVVYVEMQSDRACTNPVNSNSITIHGAASLVPSISIVSDQGNAICPDMDVMFIATAIHAGDDPVVQWYKNGIPVGDGEDTYEPDFPLQDGDDIYVTMISSEACATTQQVSSQHIKMRVSHTLPLTAIISANPAGAICNGTEVVFTAAVENGGANPVYHWQKNGAPVGDNSPVYTTASLLSGDIVQCIVTGSLPCAAPANAFSNALTISSAATTTVDVFISAYPSGAICTGAPVVYTAHPSGAGTSPVYHWKKNGQLVGTNSGTYETSALANGDVITCEVVSNLPCANPTTAVSNMITVLINPNIAPTVTITSSNTGSICAGTLVVFTATPVNGGLNPVYQWKVNGNIVPGSSNSFSSDQLTNGSVVSCTMTSSLYCVTPSMAVSNNIVISVNGQITPPSVSISVSPGNYVCAGSNVTFNANVVNGEPGISYHWKFNGNDVGTNSPVFSTILTTGGVVRCVVSVASGCIPVSSVQSNAIIMYVASPAETTVTIQRSGTGTICPGNSISFTASPQNVANAAYQWKINGINAGTNSPVFTTSSLTSSSTITCVLTGLNTCGVPVNITSNAIAVPVLSNATPVINIIPNTGNAVCQGTLLQFTATTQNGGNNPSYQWKVNGLNVGTNSPTFSSSTLTNGNSVNCIMTSSLSCANPLTVSSNVLTVNIGPFTPSVQLAVNTGPVICAGTTATFTAIPTYGGTSPLYQWKKNGINVATGSTFTTSAINNNDVISCVMTSNASCITTTTATSNNIVMAVATPGPAAISILASPSDSVCTGTPVTFSATTTRAGSAPVLLWKKNGTVVFTGDVFTTNTLVQGDVISCEMTSSLSCASPGTVVSNAITMTVKPQPVVTIDPGILSVCEGQTATLTADITGGFTPSYQLNSSVNTGSLTGYTGNTTVVCDCPAGSVAVGYRGGSGAWMDRVGLICKTLNADGSLGNTVQYTNTVGAVAGAPNGDINSPDFITTGTNVLTGLICTGNQYTAFGNFLSSIQGTYLSIRDVGQVASGNHYLDQFGPTGLPLNTVNVTQGYIITGIEGHEDVSPATGDTYASGLKLRYRQLIKGNRNGTITWSVGSNVSTIDITPPVGTNNYTATFTQPFGCIGSATTQVIVSPLVHPAVTIAANPGTTVTFGTPVTFTATGTGGGSTPIYQWIKNGAIVGINSSSYTDNALVDGDVISCNFYSSIPTCVDPSMAVSNELTMSVNATFARLCPGTNTSFSSNISGTSYQWQVNTGSGFVAISNNTNYSGVNTATLQLTNIPSAWYGYQYRCVVNSNNSSLHVLKFEMLWNGSVNSNWSNSSNWGCSSIPDGNTDVIISLGIVLVDINATCRTLSTSNGAQLTVANGVTLTVTH